MSVQRIKSDEGYRKDQRHDGSSRSLMERSDYERLRWRCIRRALLELDVTLTRFWIMGLSN